MSWQELNGLFSVVVLWLLNDANVLHEIIATKYNCAFLRFVPRRWLPTNCIFICYLLWNKSRVADVMMTRIVGDFPQGCAAFSRISPNVASEESAMRDDMGTSDMDYTEVWRHRRGWVAPSMVFLQDHLCELLEQCASYLEQAERYELMGEVYKLVVPIYEKKRDFQVKGVTLAKIPAQSCVFYF